MKGRGSRTISHEDFQIVTPDGRVKDRFVIVDAMGVCERAKVDNPSLDRKPSAPLKSILDAIGKGSIHPDLVSTLASRLARLNQQLTPVQQESLQEIAGAPLPVLNGALVQSVDPDAAEERAKQEFGVADPTEEQVQRGGELLRQDAVMPFLDNNLRTRILDFMRDNEQVIDHVSTDTLQEAGYSEAAREKAKAMTDSIARYLEEHRDEITAIQLLYSRPHAGHPTLKQIRELAQAIQAPPLRWTAEGLWRAYEALEKSRVYGSGKRVVTDLVSLVRFALQQDSKLVPYSETVSERFARWLRRQEEAGQVFTLEQRHWLEMIRAQVANSLSVEVADFDEVPFSQEGGLGRAYELFGQRLYPLLNELNGELAA